MAALLFIDAASYHEVCKKCNYLRRDSRLENGWHISHLCPYRHKCSTFLLHMQWYSSRVGTDFVHKSWHIAGTAPIYTFSKNIFPVYFTAICFATAYLIQVSCYHNCLAVLLCFFYHKYTHGYGQNYVYIYILSLQ